MWLLKKIILRQKRVLIFLKYLGKKYENHPHNLRLTCFGKFFNVSFKQFTTNKNKKKIEFFVLNWT